MPYTTRTTVHGNVNRLGTKDVPLLQPAKRRFLYTDYVFDFW